MISSNCDFSDFVAAIKNKPYHDIIYSADQEATAAERLLFRSGVDDDKKKKCAQTYASILKDLVSFMRYDVRLKSKSEYFDVFASILESAYAKEMALQDQ
ncbi:MAG: hypothetical protein PVG70_19480 [Desulfobacterales bacterium]|jgi:hypothetical protein